MNNRIVQRAITFVRSAHTQGSVPSTTRIYNTPARADVMAHWKPQTPDGPIHDGWALSRWPFAAKSKNGFYFKALIFFVSGWWAPFLIVEYQLRKAKQ